MAAEVSVVNDDGTLKLLRLLRAYVKEGVSNAEARKGLMVVAGEHLRRLPPLGQRARELSKALATVQEPKSRPSNQFWLVATLRSSEDEKQTWLHSTLTDFKDGSDAPRDRAAVVVLERLGAPSKTRTCDLLVRSQTLYPTELWARRGRPHPHYQHGHERYETVTISQDKTAVRRARFGRSRLGKREPANAFQAAGCL
jgi:hypothetical protein